ncbi:MAG TPA: hypothetical protein VHC69_34150 [Polyangiaceae bacterium]|nr:hypothetical protein [Polyangiaceae bacterium]
MVFARSLRAAHVALTAALLVVRSARAGDGALTPDAAGIVLLAGTCVPPGVNGADVMLILDAELSPMRVEPLTASSVDAAVAVLGIDACAVAPPSAKISVWRHGTRRERIVVLQDVAPGTESRTLALALAEALRDPTVTEPAPPAPAPWQQPPPARAIETPNAPPTELPRSAAPRRGSSVLAPRAGVSFRFVPASSTAVLGVDGGIAFDRFAAGLTVQGARRSVDLGDATLLAFAANASADAIALSPATFVRVEAELGVALGVGTPSSLGEGHSHAGPHAALLGGLAQRAPLVGGYELELFVAGGYASSLDADAEGRRVVGFRGGLLSVSGSVLF